MGVGKGTDIDELDEMAGGKGKAFTAKSFDQLISGDFVKAVESKTCSVGKLKGYQY